MARIDRNSANLCLRDQAKRLEKLLFAATNDAAIDGIAHRLLSCYQSQRLLFSHSKNNFSTTPTPIEKPSYTYCRGFFVDFIYSTTIDIITNNILFSIFKQRAYVYIRLAGWRYQFAYIVFSIRAAGWRPVFACSILSGWPAHGTLLQQNVYPDPRLTAVKGLSVCFSCWWKWCNTET